MFQAYQPLRTISVEGSEPFTPSAQSTISKLPYENMFATKSTTVITAHNIKQSVVKIARTSVQVPRFSAPATSNHATASTLTATLLNRTPLPKAFALWKPLVDSLKSFPVPAYGVLGVGVGFGAIYFLNRILKGYYSRKNVRMVISFIVHKVQQNDELWHLLKTNPEELLALLEKDINAFVDWRITKEDGETIKTLFKRDLNIIDHDAQGQTSKKRKLGHAEETHIKIEEDDVDISMHDAPSLPTSSNSEPEEQPTPDMLESTLNWSDDHPQTTYAVVENKRPIVGAYYPTIVPKPTQEPSSRQPDRKRTETPQSEGSYGLDYSDFSSSSSSPSVQPLLEESPSCESPLASRSTNAIDRAIETSFVSLASKSSFRRPPHAALNRPKAVKPANPFPKTPPTAIARVSQNRVVGTDLSPVVEASSDVSSVDEKKTQYRVAGTRKFYSTTKAADVGRAQRRSATREVSPSPQPPQTPRPKRARKSAPAETPTRRSSRKTTYKGVYQK